MKFKSVFSKTKQQCHKNNKVYRIAKNISANKEAMYVQSNTDVCLDLCNLDASLMVIQFNPPWAVPALAKAGPDCNPCGGPLKATVHCVSYKNHYKISPRALCGITLRTFKNYQCANPPRAWGSIVSNQSNWPKTSPDCGHTFYCSQLYIYIHMYICVCVYIHTHTVECCYY
jgi:hypothetical protein